MTLIYKIVPRPLWQQAQAVGLFTGATVDLVDGFIHFSAADLVAATAAKHFAGQDGLLLVAVEAEALGDDLRWEASRGGALFPHLYAPLRVDQARSVEPLPLAVDGHHDLSGLLAAGSPA